MRIKVKIFKRIISLLCVISMATLSMINSVGAIDTIEGEVAFSMAYMNCLPEKGKADFDKFSGKFERGKAKDKFGKTFYGKLQKQRLYEKVKCSDDFGRFYDKDITIKEKEVYVKIKKKVKELKDKVDERTPNKEMTQEKIEEGIINRTISKHWKMPKRWRIAKAIYRWVAREIKYDYDSIKKDENGQESFRKPQDPLFVFDQKTGICVGKANLVNLMMRMAGVPSAVIVSDTHVFNAIYLKNKNKPGRNGWTLIDAMGGVPESGEEMLKMSDKPFLKSGVKKLNYRLVDRINQINRLIDRGKLKDSREYSKKFKVFCERLYEKHASELKYCVGILRDYYKEHNSLEAVKARNRVNEIVNNINNEIEHEIARLNLQYKDIAKFKSFKVGFLEADVVLYEDISRVLYASMEVDLSLKEAEKIKGKFNYWLDRRRVYFPGFYDKELSFKDANEDIIHKPEHKIEQVVFGNWFDETEKNSVFNLKINGITYKKLRCIEGSCYGIELSGDESQPLENVKISPDMANLGIPLRIGCGIKSLILQGNENIDWSNTESLKTVDVTESNNYMVENGVLYVKKDGLKGNKVDVPKQIQFVNQKDNRKKIEMAKNKLCNEIKEYYTYFNFQNTKNDAKVEQLNDEMTQRYNNIGNNLTNKDVVEFEGLIRKSIKKIQSFKEKCLFNQNTELKKANEKFYSWAKSKRIDSKKYKYIEDRENKAHEFFQSSFDFGVIDFDNAKKFMQLSKDAIDMMHNFKMEYEKLEDRKNKIQEKNEMIEDKTIQDRKSNKKIIKKKVKRSKRIDGERLEIKKKDKKLENENNKQVFQEEKENKSILKKFKSRVITDKKKVTFNDINIIEYYNKKKTLLTAQAPQEKNKYIENQQDGVEGFFLGMDMHEEGNNVNKTTENQKQNKIKKKGRKSKKVDDNIVQRQEREEREKREKEEKATENRNEIPKETRERKEWFGKIIAYIKGKIENEQDELRYQNSQNARNRFMQLACLIENIENELKNERFKDSNKLEEYENQINNIVNEMSKETRERIEKLKQIIRDIKSE